MKTVEFVKMHSSGNDFVIVRETDRKRNWSKLAPRVCDRRLGVGCDGILVVLPSTKADFRARVINPDGSEAEICGNGLVCLGRYALESSLVPAERRTVAVETASGVKRVELSVRSGTVRESRVGMGRPRFRPEEIPLAIGLVDGSGDDPGPVVDYPMFAGNRRLVFTFVNMGNPHAVHFTMKPLEDFPLTKLGPIVEHHPLFPMRVNFEVARVVGRDRVEARVWERGAGETLACGSGACAIAVAARLHGYVDDTVQVQAQGGVLGVEWDGSGEVTLTGSPETVFTGLMNDAGGRARVETS